MIIKRLCLSILFSIILLPFCKAQYTAISCGPNVTPAVNYVFLGSLRFSPDNSTNSQNLKVDSTGGGGGLMIKELQHFTSQIGEVLV